MKKGKKFKKKTKGSRYSKLSLFQKPDVKFFRPCPLSGKDAPVIDYKNIKLLRKYISESGKILPSRVTSVSLKKQKELTNSIKRARLLALIWKTTMEIVLLENIKNLGKIGDIAIVKRGHARNFLIKYGKALKASKDNISLVNKKKEGLNAKNLTLKKEAKKIFDVINNKKFKFSKRTKDNDELYGSIKPKELSKAIENIEKIEIRPSQIDLGNEINKVGSYEAKINLHAEIMANIHIEVVKEKEEN